MLYRVIATTHKSLNAFKEDLDKNGRRGAITGNNVHRYMFAPNWFLHYLEINGRENCGIGRLYALPAETKDDESTITLLKVICPDKIIAIAKPMTLDDFSDAVYFANKAYMKVSKWRVYGDRPSSLQGLIPLY